MNEVFRQIGTSTPGGIVCVVDHASNAVPADIDLGIPAHLLHEHIAVDIGTAAIAELLGVDMTHPAVTEWTGKLLWITALCGRYWSGVLIA